MLLQNPFEFAASDAAAEKAVASLTQPPAQDATADLSEPATDGGGPQESPAPGQELCGAGDLGPYGIGPATYELPAIQAENERKRLELIGEIFVGARKLFDPDPAAYPREDELYYDVLKAMDNPHERDLPSVPQGLIEAMEPMPLFLRQAV